MKKRLSMILLCMAIIPPFVLGGCAQENSTVSSSEESVLNT